MKLATSARAAFGLTGDSGTIVRRGMRRGRVGVSGTSMTMTRERAGWAESESESESRITLRERGRAGGGGGVDVIVCGEEWRVRRRDVRRAERVERLRKRRSWRMRSSRW